MLPVEKIGKILDCGSTVEKIKILEILVNTKDPRIIEKIIAKLSDPEIEVRGEAFSSLVLNKNRIMKFLTDGLFSDDKNIRAFSALILANRGDSKSIPSIIPLTADQSSLVRSCALGALGHLKAHQAKKSIQTCLTDENLEVRKSAVKALMNIGDKIPSSKINEAYKDADPELKKLLEKITR